MPGGRLRPTCRHVFALVGVVFLLPASAAAQTGGVMLKGSVSETVALSIPPSSTFGDVHAGVVSSGRAVRMTLSGKGSGSPVIRVPLMVRSNSGFKISGKFESTTALLDQLSVIDVRATGRLVSAAALENLQIQPEFDRRGFSENTAPESLDVSAPFLVLSGPRVSLGGTLVSPDNALQITLLICIKSSSVGDWVAHLTFFND